MQKVKEEVILRILVQESLNLELWLERCEELNFEDFFINLSGLRTSLELFFKNQGSNCENSRPRVDYPKV
jgi:hypothetical protein